VHVWRVSSRNPRATRLIGLAFWQVRCMPSVIRGECAPWQSTCISRDMHDDLLRRLNGVLERIEHATVATVSADGRPWNTPVFFARHGMSLYWLSRRDAQHSINIERNGRAFIVVFDSSREDADGACVYLEADVAALTADAEICEALERIYRRRQKPMPSPGQLSPGSPHAIYHARAVRVWSNVLHTSEEIPWDERVELNTSET